MATDEEREEEEGRGTRGSSGRGIYRTNPRKEVKEQHSGDVYKAKVRVCWGGRIINVLCVSCRELKEM